MLRLLLKKQFTEVFRSIFYDAKKNRMRSKGAIAGLIFFYVFIFVGMLGGLFTSLAISICAPLLEANVGWLYFLLLSAVAIFLGAFGSVFNTYAGLYLAKDNDLLLSLPIPVRTIIASRLINVYLLGALYSGVVMLPALGVYWGVAGITVSRLLCGLILLFIVTVVVLLLSCLLGLAVAKVSVKIKNKSFFTVFLSLLFIAGYYFVYFKAQEYIRTLVENAAVYGEKIRGAAAVLWAFGRIGEGDWLWTAVFFAVAAALTALTWALLSKSFLRIAGEAGIEKKTRLSERSARTRPAFGALLGREFSAFFSNANYMLNCGLGVLLLPALGVVLLVKGTYFFGILGQTLPNSGRLLPVLAAGVVIFACTMIETAAPSVSLEGKTLWILQSMPIPGKSVLRAKAAMQAILSVPSVLFTGICAAVSLDADLPAKLFSVLFPAVFALFFAAFCTVIGVKMPLLDWTNPITPIKQSGAVMVTTFGGWGICLVAIGPYFLLGSLMGPAPYLAALTLIFAVLAAVLLRWLDEKGSLAFDALS